MLLKIRYVCVKFVASQLLERQQVSQETKLFALISFLCLSYAPNELIPGKSGKFHIIVFCFDRCSPGYLLDQGLLPKHHAMGYDTDLFKIAIPSPFVLYIIYLKHVLV